jgi:hypothetical protein
MKCPHCGAEVPGGDRFCGECGQSLQAAADTQQTMYAPAVQEPAVQTPVEPSRWPPPQSAVPPQAASWPQSPPVAAPASGIPGTGARKRRFPWLIAVIVVLGLCVICAGGGTAAYFLVLRPRLASTGGAILTAVVTAVVTPSDVIVSTPVAAVTATPTATPVPTSTFTPVPTTTYSDGYGGYTVAYPVGWVVVGETPGEYAFLAETELVSDDLAAGPFFLSLTNAGISDLETLRQEVVDLYAAYDVRELQSVPAQFGGIESMALTMAAMPPATSAEVQIHALLAIRDGVGQAFLFGVASERWDQNEPLFQQMAESLSLQGTVTQPVPTPLPQITSLVFASAVDELDNPVGVTDIYPPGTTEVYAVFTYEGFGGLTEYEPVFLLDGELDASEPLALEGDEQGQTWLRRYNDGGLAAGTHTLEIYVGDEQLADGAFTVLGGNIVLQDDFSDSATGWRTWDGEDSRVWYEGERLHVLIIEEGWMAYPTYVPEAGDMFADMYIEADAALVEIPEQGGDYGLVARRPQDGDYYQFVISDDGFFKIRKHTGEGWTVLLDWVESDAIIQGVNGVNRLQALCWGSELLFYVNGVFLGRAEDDAFASGRIGVSTGSFEGGPGVHAVFDNVVVWELE